jgi:MarR family 2-MHQ and catechol resistance regulon transcriptional repressor
MSNHLGGFSIGTNMGSPRGRQHEKALSAYIKLLRANKSLQNRLERHLAARGLTESQFGVLEALLHLGPMCQRELGDKILRSGANVTTVVHNLEKQKLVHRERTGDDKRFVTVHLTDGGRALVREVFPQHAARIAEALAVLEPAELAELDRLCRKLGLAVAALGEDV